MIQGSQVTSEWICLPSAAGSEVVSSHDDGKSGYIPSAAGNIACWTQEWIWELLNQSKKRDSLSIPEITDSRNHSPGEPHQQRRRECSKNNTRSNNQQGTTGSNKMEKQDSCISKGAARPRTAWGREIPDRTKGVIALDEQSQPDKRRDERAPRTL